MSEDRTQDPSKHRLQQARERGQVVHSAELTGAVALLAASALIGAFGDDLATALVAALRAPLSDTPLVTADPSEVVARFRQLALAVCWPLGAVIAGAAAAAVAAHQAQVQGLWAPGLLAPDPMRLWAVGQGQGFAARVGRGGWGLVKAAVVAGVAAWAIRSGWPGARELATMETPELAREAGRALGGVALMLAAATVALGAVDFWLQSRRYEAMLRMTPQEQREDQRSIDGDPAIRARRRRIARSWRGDSGEVLVGATLMLTGPGGLTLVLAGGPPPKRVSLRSALQGPAGLRLRNAAEAAKLPQVVAPALARRLAGRPAPALPISAELLAELAAVWPGHAG